MTGGRLARAQVDATRTPKAAAMTSHDTQSEQEPEVAGAHGQPTLPQRPEAADWRSLISYSRISSERLDRGVFGLARTR